MALEVRPLVKFVVTSPYGMRDLDHDDDTPETLHRGIDLQAAVGTPLYAMGSGFVRAAGAGAGGTGGGNAVDIVDDDDGRYVYLHLSGIDPSIRPGVRVRAGQLVGLTGMTGDVTGPHLHLQWQPAWPVTQTEDIGPVLADLGSPEDSGGGFGLVLLGGAAAGGLYWLTKRKRRR